MIREDLAKKLNGRICNYLKGVDDRAWGSNPKGKFTMASGYREKDRLAFGEVCAP